MRTLIREASKDAMQHLLFRDRFLWRLPRAAGEVALTFDDGPHPEHTPAVLDMLAQAGVRATFFVVGERVEEQPHIARRIAQEGHALAGHGYDHRVITSLGAAELVDDLQRCRRAIADATGVDTELFRPPKGEVSLASIRTVCGAGYTLVHWSKTFSDYRQDGVAPLAARIAALPPVSGDVLLFHDNNGFTVEALRQCLPGWQAAGLQFRALPERCRAGNSSPNVRPT